MQDILKHFSWYLLKNNHVRSIKAGIFKLPHPPPFPTSSHWTGIRWVPFEKNTSKVFNMIQQYSHICTDMNETYLFSSQQFCPPLLFFYGLVLWVVIVGFTIWVYDYYERHNNIPPSLSLSLSLFVHHLSLLLFSSTLRLAKALSKI